MARGVIPATAARRGRAFEWRVRAVLEQAGWRVIRSAGSRTPVDLVAWAPTGRCWFVQCKGRTGGVWGADRAAWLDWADQAAADPVLARPFGLQGIRWQVWDRMAGRWQIVDPAVPPVVRRPWWG